MHCLQARQLIPPARGPYHKARDTFRRNCSAPSAIIYRAGPGALRDKRTPAPQQGKRRKAEKQSYAGVPRSKLVEYSTEMNHADDNALNPHLYGHCSSIPQEVSNRPATPSPGTANVCHFYAQSGR